MNVASEQVNSMGGSLGPLYKAERSGFVGLGNTTKQSFVKQRLVDTNINVLSRRVPPLNLIPSTSQNS